MNLKQLEAFVQVADSGSFSKAAKELYLTQPTISAHIASLEKELNARLFVRNTKEVNLSQDGDKLYEYARAMIDMEKKIEQVFSLEKEQSSQYITIAASTIPAQYLLPRILARFNEKYPMEQFKVMEMDSSRVVEHVVANSIDVGFTGTMLEKKHCKYIPFYHDELVIITPNTEKYQKIREEQTDINWLCEESILMREEGSGTRKEAEKQLKKSGISMSMLNVVASIENPETIKKSVANGMGISVISKLAAQEEIEGGRMLSFSLPIVDGGRSINVVYNRNYQMSRLTEKFLRVVKEVYQYDKK
ncbi:MAG: selenium metabolism-associated LysR family transcriptional regulator [Lachnospiraceae bacterium]